MQPNHIWALIGKRPNYFAELERDQIGEWQIGKIHKLKFRKKGMAFLGRKIGVALVKKWMPKGGLVLFRLMLKGFGLFPAPQNNSVLFEFMLKWDSVSFQCPKIIWSHSVRSQSFGLGIAPVFLCEFSNSCNQLFSWNSYILFSLLCSWNLESSALPRLSRVSKSPHIRPLWAYIYLDFCHRTTAKLFAKGLESTFWKYIYSIMSIMSIK
jgi:hypothetical protein